jgi:hypothetical protein
VHCGLNSGARFIDRVDVRVADDYDVDVMRCRTGIPERIGGRGLIRIDPTQAAVVGALAGDGPLVVVEGAAGAGKTTALRSTQELLSRRGQPLGERGLRSPDSAIRMRR